MQPMSKVDFQDQAFVIKEHLKTSCPPDQQEYWQNRLANCSISLEKKKDIAEIISSPSAEQIFSEYCKSSDIVGERASNDYNETTFPKKLHDSTVKTLIEWRQNVLSKFSGKQLDQHAQGFLSYLTALQIPTQYNPQTPRLPIGLAFQINEKLNEIHPHTKVFSKIQVPLKNQQAYLHVYSAETKEYETTQRFYMNIDLSNRAPLMDMIRKVCESKGMAFHGKFCQNDEPRKDNFLVYTNEFEFEQVVNIIKSIKTQSPNLFKGADDKSLLWGSVKGAEFIGYGENPMHLIDENCKAKETSYTGIRKKIFEEYRNQHGDAFDQDKFAVVCKAFGVSPDNFSLNLDTERYRQPEHYNKRQAQIQSYQQEVRVNTNVTASPQVNQQPMQQTTQVQSQPRKQQAPTHNVCAGVYKTATSEYTILNNSDGTSTIYKNGELLLANHKVRFGQSGELQFIKNGDFQGHSTAVKERPQTQNESGFVGMLGVLGSFKSLNHNHVQTILQNNLDQLFKEPQFTFPGFVNPPKLIKDEQGHHPFEKQQYEIMAHYLQTATSMGKRDEFLQHPQISGIMQNMMGDPVMIQSLQNLQNKQKNIDNA